jgi:hypothetical protein
MLVVSRSLPHFGNPYLLAFHFTGYSSHPVQNLILDPDWYMKWLGKVSRLYLAYYSNLRTPPPLSVATSPPQNVNGYGSGNLTI